jgi:hypothetical protein
MATSVPDYGTIAGGAEQKFNAANGGAQQTKVINGVTYIKVAGGWQKQQ